jgi:hypothetical protein
MKEGDYYAFETDVSYEVFIVTRKTFYKTFYKTWHFASGWSEERHFYNDTNYGGAWYWTDNTKRIQITPEEAKRKMVLWKLKGEKIWGR